MNGSFAAGGRLASKDKSDDWESESPLSMLLFIAVYLLLFHARNLRCYRGECYPTFLFFVFLLIPDDDDGKENEDEEEEEDDDDGGGDDDDDDVVVDDDDGDGDDDDDVVVDDDDGDDDDDVVDDDDGDDDGDGGGDDDDDDDDGEEAWKSSCHVWRRQNRGAFCNDYIYQFVLFTPPCQSFSHLSAPPPLPLFIPTSLCNPITTPPPMTNQNARGTLVSVVESWIRSNFHFMRGLQSKRRRTWK